ncbi:MAG TPA: hypothetical protein VI072_36055 [Polyangiaceae bacterium]
MRARATAVATDQSNAVGTVELECSPQGLSILYLGVGAFSEGYAPGALTNGTRVLAPWARVLEARVEGNQIFIALDPSVTPHHRLTLRNFSIGDGLQEQELGRQRFIVRVGAIGAAAVLSLVAATVAARLPAGVAASAALLVGLAAAGLVLAVGLLAERRLGFVRFSSDVVRRMFAASLVNHLPSVLVSPVTPPARRIGAFGLPAFAGVLPRTTLAVVITLTAGMLGSVLTARYMIHEQEQLRLARYIAEQHAARAPAPREPAARPAARAPEPVARAAAPPPPPASSTVAQVMDRCICHRADSALWTRTIPRLSLLVLSKRGKTDRDGDRELEVEVAAVNNGDRELRELALLVRFFERDPAPSKKRHWVADRPLYFEGPLTPGGAIKWRIEAPGQEFELENPIAGDIGPSGDSAAPTNLLAELQDAKHRPVRMHGAMMLAYLGDPRAREAAMKLKEALRDNEAPYLDRVLSAVADVRGCDLELSGDGAVRSLKACVYNASDEARSELGLRLRALEGEVTLNDPVGEPPNVLSEHTWQVPGRLDPHAGVRVTARVELGESSRSAPAFEVYADRIDLLR